MIFCSHFAFLPDFGLNRHLPSPGPETHSLGACLSLCPSSNRVLSLSITLGIRLFPPDTRATFFRAAFSPSRLPHGNLGELNTKHTFGLLRI